MFFVITAEEPANPLSELVSTGHSLGLNYLAFAVNPLGLDRIEPRAPGGQQTRHYADPTAPILDLAVLGGDPLSHLSAFVPACVVPDQEQSLLASRLEPLATPPEKLCGYGAHRATIHESQPRLFELRRIQPVAGESLGVGIVLSGLLLEEAHRLARLLPGMHRGSLEAAEPTLILKTQEDPLRMGLGEPDQPISIPFFLSYSGSGLSIQRFALCQRTPRRTRVARMVSALTRLWVRPSSKLTCAAYSSVHRVPSLPNFLGSWWSISCKARALCSSKAAWTSLGREEPCFRASRPFSLKAWMALRTVCWPQRRFSAIRGERSPFELAKRIWQRRRTKASEERNPASKALRSSFESVRTKIGGFMSITVTHHSQPVLKTH